MAQLSPHFEKLKSAFIFPVVQKKRVDFQKKYPDRKILNLGIGDTTLPLAPKIAQAIHEATLEMSQTAHGYGPTTGYPFLKEAICEHEYAQYDICPDEIFISDGAKTDTSAILELFDENCTVAITDPTYPVYKDVTLLSGKKLLSLPLREDDGFLPKPPIERADIVYLCTPCNPTGIALNHSQLQAWVDWARKHNAILIVDSVYAAFRSSEEIPSSIYAIEGSHEVAIEMQSFSKSAGFTGLRCGYTVIPKALSSLHKLWTVRSNIKTNGVSYPIQRGAAACFTPEGHKQLKSQIATYQSSAKILRTTLKELEQTFYGGLHSPYIWWKATDQMRSWEFFDHLFETTGIIGIPGNGFGPSGEGFLRLSCFLSNPLAKEASNALHHHFVPA